MYILFMIFNFLKSKPSLKEIIPDGFVDIHSHILPGIDDGAKNLKESLQLISEMKKLGFQKVICTPHTYKGLYNNDNKSINKSFENLVSNMKEKINIDFASEYLIDESIFDKIKSKSLLTFNNNYVLIEMSFMSAPNILYEIIFELMVNNYKPILAHPERYCFLHDDFNEYYKLKRAGCLFQINLLSVIGYYGKSIKSISDKLLKKKLINFAGSDIHSMQHIYEFNKKVQINEIRELVKVMENNKIFI